MPGMEKSTLKDLVSKSDLWLAVYGELKHEKLSTDHYASQACHYLLTSKMNSMCYKNGREIDGSQSAEVLRLLAKVYRLRSPDKLSLVKSAALFKAAIVREPHNVAHINLELEELCSHVLHLAKATKINANLGEASTGFFDQVQAMRGNVTQMLQGIETPIPDNLDETERINLELGRIEQVSTIQTSIAQQYSDIMKQIMKKCVEIIGTPPCEYALVGMGSLARREITPYSDFEHIIILEDGVQTLANYEEILEYFRWVSVIFQIILVSFGETIVRRLYIEGLNCEDDSTRNEEYFDEDTISDTDEEMVTDEGSLINQNTTEFIDTESDINMDDDWFFDKYTTCGISPDGFAPHASKNPLGRPKTKGRSWETGLIKPVSVMVEYLETDKDLKNGYHLADMLLKTCFVGGKKKIYEEFNEKVSAYRKKLSSSSNFRDQIDEDIDNFDVMENLHSFNSYENFDVKRVLYRSVALFVAALGRYHSLEANSSLDVVEELERNNVIGKTFSHKLKFALTVSMEIRLKVYMHCKGQYDNLSSDMCQPNAIDFGLVGAVGLSSLVQFFGTCFQLQRFVEKNLFQENRIQEKDAMDTDLGPSDTHYDLFQAFFFMVLQWFDKSKEKSENCLKNSSPEIQQVHYIILANSLFRLGNYELACEHCEMLLIEKYEKFYIMVSGLYGGCLRYMKQYEKALAKLQLSMHKPNATNHYLQEDDRDEEGGGDSVGDEDDDNVDNEQFTADIWSWTGDCLSILGMHSEAVKCFKTARDIYASLGLNEEQVSCLTDVGDNLIELGQVKKANAVFLKVLTIQKYITEDETKDEDIAENLNSIHLCLIELDQIEKAHEYKRQELKIYNNLLDEFEEISNDQRSDEDVVQYKIAKAKCLFHLEKTAESRKELLEDLLSYDVSGFSQDVQIIYFSFMQYYYVDLEKFELATDFFEREVNLKEKSIEGDEDRLDLAECFHSYGEIMTKNNLKGFEAQSWFEREYDLLCKVDETNTDVEFTLLEQLGNCYLSLGQFEQAVKTFDEQLGKVDQSLIACSSTKFATSLNHIRRANCYQNKAEALEKSCVYTEALQNYQLELDLRQKLREEHETHLDVAVCFVNIGYCHFSLNHFDKAMCHFEESLNIIAAVPLSQHAAETRFCALSGKSKCLSKEESPEHLYKECISDITSLMRICPNGDDQNTSKIWLEEIESCNTCSETLECFRKHRSADRYIRMRYKKILE